MTCARRSTRPATSSRMPDASPANGRPAASDQPTTDLNRLWARPAAADRAAAQEWGNGSAYAARSEAEPTADRRPGTKGAATARPNGPEDASTTSEPTTESASTTSERMAESASTTSEPVPGSKSAPNAKTNAEPKAEPKSQPQAKATGEGEEQQETLTGDRAGFRLAAFGALLVVVLFAGYGLGRLNSGGTTSASAPPTTAAAGGSMPGMDENQPHTHNVGGTV